MALKELINDQDIMIKKSYKGGAVVILSVKHYEKMVYSQLHDKNTYKKLDSNIDSKIMSNLIKLIKEYKSNFTENELKYLLDTKFSTSQFYGLPKLHKSKLLNKVIKGQNSEIINYPEPDDLKLRPIISGINCPTKKLSNLIDKILKPLLKHVKSYIRDSIQFLNKSRRTVKEDTTLVTFDVISLYTNIPHELGVDALQFFLNKYPETVDNRFNRDFIMKGMLFVLKNNTFIFNTENYLQLTGTAMGTISAPTYATLVVAYLEEKLYTILEIEYSPILSEYIRENWSRFLDDCFILLEGNTINPHDLLTIINSLHKNIQFTMELSNEKIPFLDIMVNKSDEKIWMDTYSKPTDSKRYVPYNSCHPKSCLTSIPIV